MKRHLHRDYSHSFCGKDASHILMTHDPAETDCAPCKAAHAKHLKAQAAEVEAIKAARARLPKGD